MRLILFLALAIPAFSQTPYAYTASTGQVSVVSSTYAATLQQPAATCGPAANQNCSLPVSFPVAIGGGYAGTGASVICSVACTATLSRNCSTPATATVGSIVGGNVTAPPPLVTFFTASNASGCIAIRTFPVAAGQEYSIDLSRITMGAGGTGVSLTLSVASLTGTVNISFFPIEAH